MNTTTKKPVAKKNYGPSKAQVAALKKKAAAAKAVPADKASKDVKAARKATKQASKAVSPATKKQPTNVIAKKTADTKAAKKLAKGVKVTKVAEGVGGRVRKAKAAPAVTKAAAKSNGKREPGALTEKRQVLFDLLTRKSGATMGELLKASGMPRCRTTLNMLSDITGKRLEFDDGVGEQRKFWLV